MPLALILFEIVVAVGLSGVASRRPDVQPMSNPESALDGELQKILAEEREAIPR